MRLAFLLECPNVRGTSVASYDYALYNEELLNNESMFICNKAKETEFHPLGLKRIQQRFPIVYLNQLDDLDDVLKREKADFMYTLRTGHLEPGIPKECPTGVHVMFQHYEPHGTVYAYISQWLSLRAKKHIFVDVPYVPHMVYGPKEPNINLRKRVGIPKNAIVFGRYGGFTQFDIAMVQRAVVEVVERTKDRYFLFMNTKKFADHPRIKFLPPTTNLQNKCNFIHACDAMLHARRLGESFGMSIAEFLYQGKPIIAWATGNDLNHVHMLGKNGIFYNTDKDLIPILLSFAPRAHNPTTYQGIAAQFSPQRTMEQFEKVFLNPLH